MRLLNKARQFVLSTSSLAAAVALVSVTSCEGGGSPSVESQTNWFVLCDENEDCGELSCICSVCSTSCSTNSDCDSLEGARCVDSSEPGATVLCGGSSPNSTGMCVLGCDLQSCAEGFSCQAGVCAPKVEASATLTVDSETSFQTLLGFGAAIGSLAEDELLAHPDKETILDAMFLDSGFNFLRLINRFGSEYEEEMEASASILASASDRLGKLPTTLLSSESPPDELKENGSSMCSGDVENCTLVRGPDGSFDYDSFALYWRESLIAYENAGISPDYLSIQDNPNWAPPEDTSAFACRFLPTEGSEQVGDLDLTFPGYREALDAVSLELATLSNPPKVIIAEASGVNSSIDFISAVGTEGVDALAFHMYGVDVDDVPTDALSELGAMAQNAGLPLFQSEMGAEGMETAILMHHALTSAGASVYVQNDFVASSAADGGDPAALISLTEDAFQLEAPYHAMRHFSQPSGEGWLRLEASCASEALLCSAWQSPNEDALSLVVINTGDKAEGVTLELGSLDDQEFTRSEVTRTVFSGDERSAELGELAEGVVELPGRSMVTIALFR